MIDEMLQWLGKKCLCRFGLHDTVPNIEERFRCGGCGATWHKPPRCCPGAIVFIRGIARDVGPARCKRCNWVGFTKGW